MTPSNARIASRFLATRVAERFSKESDDKTALGAREMEKMRMIFDELGASGLVLIGKNLIPYLPGSVFSPKPERNNRVPNRLVLMGPGFSSSSAFIYTLEADPTKDSGWVMTGSMPFIKANPERIGQWARWARAATGEAVLDTRKEKSLEDPTGPIGAKIKGMIDNLRDQQAEISAKIKNLDDAWKNWDLGILEDLRVISDRERQALQAYFDQQSS